MIEMIQFKCDLASCGTIEGHQVDGYKDDIELPKGWRMVIALPPDDEGPAVEAHACSETCAIELAQMQANAYGFASLDFRRQEKGKKRRR